MEVVKIQMQLATVKLGQAGGERQTASQLVRSLGISGLYKNASATLIRDVTFSVLFFPGFAYLKAYLDRRSAQQSASNAFNALIAGTVVGGVVAAVCTPTDGTVYIKHSFCQFH